MTIVQQKDLAQKLADFPLVVVVLVFSLD